MPLLFTREFMDAQMDQIHECMLYHYNQIQREHGSVLDFVNKGLCPDPNTPQILGYMSSSDFRAVCTNDK
jgi:hypothetical protein